MSFARGTSPDVAVCSWGRVDLLTGAGLEEDVDGVAAAEDEFEDGVLSLSDFGAAGARYDLRLCRSIMLIAQSCRSTGVRFAAWRKASLSCWVKR